MEICNNLVIKLIELFTLVLTDHTHPTSPLMAKPPELSDETKLAVSIKFPGTTVGKYIWTIQAFNWLIFLCNSFETITLTFLRRWL